MSISSSCAANSNPTPTTPGILRLFTGPATNYWRTPVIHNLNFRLLVAFTLVIIVTIGSAFFLTYRTTRNEITQMGERMELSQDARMQSELSSYYQIVNTWEGIQVFIEQWGELYQRRIILADKNGVIVADSDGLLLGNTYNDDLIGEEMAQIPISATGQVLEIIMPQRKGKPWVST